MKKDILTTVGVKFALNVDGAGLSSFKSGGRLSLVFYPETEKQVVSLVGVLRNTHIGFRILGGGTNTLIPDGGYDGIAVCLKYFKGIRLADADETGENHRLNIEKVKENVENAEKTPIENRKFDAGILRENVEESTESVEKNAGISRESVEKNGETLRKNTVISRKNIAKSTEKDGKSIETLRKNAGISRENEKFNAERAKKYGFIAADAGVSLPKLSAFALENSLSGLEFLGGIPGTVGGGVYMNAGAYGGEIGRVLEFCDVLEVGSGRVIRLKNGESEFSYRSSVFQRRVGEYVVLRAYFALECGDAAKIKDKMNEFKKRRAESQPKEPGLGSVFKRIDGVIPAILIDKAGLKGYNIGGAAVSDKHAGFIINSRGASSSDFIALKERIKAVVYEKYGIKLVEEIEILE
ncbi:MAG: UDP-N-acetylmuramate dehydrogenase [Clostridiales bacterium]|jgi:UDP-N-acetylmuramate dehydrogenase|nr:UDP-N-acetylmuramate dehydrogenase [Clostridiales bacterium]